MAIALVTIVVLRTVTLERDENHDRNCFVDSVDPVGIG